MIKKNIKILLYKIKVLFSTNKKTLLLEEKNIQRNVPSNFDQTESEYFEKEICKKLVQCYLFSISKGAISKEGIIYTNNNSIKESYSGINTTVENIFWNSPVRYLTEKNLCFLHTAWSDNYHHWLVELFLKLFY